MTELEKLVVDIIDNGDNIDVIDGNGNTTLIRSIMLNVDYITSALITKGSNVNVVTKNNVTPLRVSVNTENYDMFKLLIENGANINYEYENLTTILHILYERKMVKFIKVLLDDKKLEYEYDQLNLTSSNDNFNKVSTIEYHKINIPNLYEENSMEDLYLYVINNTDLRTSVIEKSMTDFISNAVLNTHAKKHKKKFINEEKSVHTVDYHVGEKDKKIVKQVTIESNDDYIHCIDRLNYIELIVAVDLNLIKNVVV